MERGPRGSPEVGEEPRDPLPAAPGVVPAADLLSTVQRGTWTREGVAHGTNVLSYFPLNRDEGQVG